MLSSWRSRQGANRPGPKGEPRSGVHIRHRTARRCSSSSPRRPKRSAHCTGHSLRVRRLMCSSSRSAYGIGLPWSVRLAAYASRAERSSARAIEELRMGRCLCAVTTVRALRTLFHKIRGLVGSARCRGWDRCRHRDGLPWVQDVSGWERSYPGPALYAGSLDRAREQVGVSRAA